MADVGQSREGQNTATVISHPTARMAERLENLAAKTLEEILAIVDEFEARKWSMEGLSKALSASGWRPLPESVDGLASYLAAHQFTHPKKDESRGSLKINNQELSDSQAQIRKLVEAVERRNSETGGIWSAARLIEILQELCGPNNPIPIMQEYARMYFEGAEIRGRDPRPVLLANSPKAMLLSKFAHELRALSPKDLRPGVLAYWFSDPAAEHQTHDMTFLRLKKVSNRHDAYRTLVLDRLLANGYTGETDPKLTKVAEWVWVLHQQMPAYRMVNVLHAVSGANDFLTVNEKDSKGDLSAALRGFFLGIEQAQAADFQGRSFLSLDAANAYGSSLPYWYPLKDEAESMSVDFPSLFATCLWDEDGDLAIWDECISRAVDLGHNQLAEALGAYILLHATLSQKGRIVWWRMISIIRRLRQEPGVEVLQTALGAAHRVFLEVFDAPIFAKRLESFVRRESQRYLSQETVGIKLVREIVAHPSKDEVRIRLREHVGSDGWAKFSSEAQGWLVEADLNWSHWRFPGTANTAPRTDWGPIANQFSKAVEQALVNRFKAACRNAELCKPNQTPTLGTVVKLLDLAVKGQQPALTAATDIIQRPVDSKLVDRLKAFTNKHRNPSSHPTLYPVEKVDDLRLELFTRGLLSRIADELL